MNNILAQLNSVPMYAICGGIIAFVAVVCVIFLVRSYRAGLAIGIDPARMKRAITSSANVASLISSPPRKCWNMARLSMSMMHFSKETVKPPSSQPTECIIKLVCAMIAGQVVHIVS